MATGGAPAPGSAEERRQSLTCCLCLDIYTAPKLLPCSHTYCLQCLKDLTACLPPSSSSFPCPQCRHLVDIPEGGVAGLKNNNYLRPDDLKAVREGSLCLTHRQEALDLYCSDCQRPVCLKCVLTQHKGHGIQDLSEAAVTARAELKDDAKRLEKSLRDVDTQAETDGESERVLRDKKRPVETVIRNKHATLKAELDNACHDMLASLNAATKDEEDRLSQRLSRHSSSRRELQQLQQQVQQALSSGCDLTQVVLATERRKDRGDHPADLAATSAATHVIRLPVVSSNVTDDVFMQNMTSYFGDVRMVEMAVTTPEVSVEQQFQCGTEPDTEVFSLCPMDTGSVFLSYCRKGFTRDAPFEMFDPQKNLTTLARTGKLSTKFRKPGNCMHCSCSDTMTAHRKSHTDSFLTLRSTGSNTAELQKVKVVSEKPFRTKTTKEFSLKVGVHRAMDVDPTDQLVAVVEEPRGPGAPRTVKLFCRSHPDPVATYRALSEPFNPSDVCFFTLGSQHALLIADEAGDSVHVVHVQDRDMTFARHLAPTSPQLVQPTALNTDHRGRLWVACRGGAVLTLTPTSQ